MTRTTNARVAGSAFLVYIVAGIASVMLFGRASAGTGMTQKLASIAAHANDAGILVLLGFVQSFSAIILGVTLYALTRDEDADVAMLGLACRVGEGVIGALSIPATLTLFWLATTGDRDAPATQTLAGYLLRDDVALPATFFAVGSTAFAYLLLRGRMTPVWMAWLGVIASVLLVVCLPLRYAGWLRGTVTMLVWLPMLVFELAFALWLILARPSPSSRTRQAAS